MTDTNNQEYNGVCAKKHLYLINFTKTKVYSS